MNKGGNPNPRTDHLEPFQWAPGQSGNPAGKPKGAKHLSTWIQEMLHEEIDFKVLVDREGRKAIYKSYKGVPIQAIIAVAIFQSMRGDKDAREWLAKHGYGTKTTLEIENPISEILNKYGLKDAGKAKTATTTSSQDTE